jgi:hypothetical protein
MIRSRIVVCFVLLVALPVRSIFAAGKKGTSSDLRKAEYPVGVYGAIEGASRFQDADYSRLFLRDGLKQCDPKIIFGIVQEAVGAQENYKALFFARIFTEMKPDLAAGWNNRAALANSLGLKDEAAASALRMTDPASITPVPLSMLPGVGLKVRPKSLADWAAAMTLVGDSLAAIGGEHFAVAVRDDISGLKVSDPEEVRNTDASLIQAGLSPTGPYALANPMQAAAVPPNLFVLKNPDPINYVTVKKFEMFGAIAMAMASGYTSNATGSEAAGQMMGDAMEVQSNYKGGSYEKGVYGDDGPMLHLTKDHPKSAGKEYAVGNPVTILWASGPSFFSSYHGRWDSKNKPWVSSTPAGQIWDSKAKWSYRRLSDLYFPKLMSFCNGACSVPVTAMEAMLTSDNVEKIAPSLTGKLVDLTEQRRSYESDKLTLGSGNAGDTYVGFDESGTVYKIQIRVSQPSGWLVEP